ncbi:hypothetical protein MKK63_11730 [Methylobacterium sp. J-088]|uniref:hypothetical protein n=1 Tax=Methylobacterium sp. J-088 TaxID=2836664 RepID=UPI001FB8D148|nr:hypothetical protein [Methylobacterium sp. J-088]MCJ2063379.1 hypothetical protein [Methylobacterium sp. J-088]
MSEGGHQFNGDGHTPEQDQPIFDVYCFLEKEFGELLIGGFNYENAGDIVEKRVEMLTQYTFGRSEISKLYAESIKLTNESHNSCISTVKLLRREAEKPRLSDDDFLTVAFMRLKSKLLAKEPVDFDGQQVREQALKILRKAERLVAEFDRQSQSMTLKEFIDVHCAGEDDQHRSAILYSMATLRQLADPVKHHFAVRDFYLWVAFILRGYFYYCVIEANGKRQDRPIIDEATSEIVKYGSFKIFEAIPVYGFVINAAKELHTNLGKLLDIKGGHARRAANVDEVDDFIQIYGKSLMTWGSVHIRVSDELSKQVSQTDEYYKLLNDYVQQELTSRK